MKMVRKAKAIGLWALAAGLLAVIGAPSTGRAATYPTKPIKFVCWSKAGSPLDTMMRQLAKQMSEVLGQSMPVENRTGGSGAVAMAYVMSQPADGYTVLSTTSSMSFTMAEGRVPFTPDNFTVLPALQAEPSAVAVRADSQFKTVKDLVAYLHAHPNGLKVGGFAAAGFHQFVFYRLQQKGDFKAAWIPFDGGNAAALALLGGHIDVAVMTPSSALAQVENGNLRLLGISTAERDAYFPNVPTFKEQGYDVVESIWRGIMVKKGTPTQAIHTLMAAMKKVEATDEWKKFMKANMQSSVHLGLDDMQKQVRAEVASRREFLKKNGYIR